MARRMAEEMNTSAKETIKAIDAFISVLSESLLTGESTFLRGFGTFHLATRKQKTARDIRNGKTITIPEHTVLQFKPCKELKDKIAKVEKS